MSEILLPCVSLLEWENDSACLHCPSALKCESSTCSRRFSSHYRTAVKASNRQRDADLVVLDKALAENKELAQKIEELNSLLSMARFDLRKSKTALREKEGYCLDIEAQVAALAEENKKVKADLEIYKVGAKVYVEETAVRLSEERQKVAEEIQQALDNASSGRKIASVENVLSRYLTKQEGK